MNKVITIKKFVDNETGDIEVVKQKVFCYINERKLKFTHAEIEQSSLRIPLDPDDSRFYPLRIFANDGTVLLISEVRTGYHGAFSEAIIDILQYAGFTLERKFVEDIFNERKLKRVIYF